MSLQAWIATRKGLFELRHEGARGWQVAGTSFLGDPVTIVLPRGAGAHAGRMLAGLNLGHFGVKVQASDDGGKIAALFQPDEQRIERSRFHTGQAAKLVTIGPLAARLEQGCKDCLRMLGKGAGSSHTG